MKIDFLPACKLPNKMPKLLDVENKPETAMNLFLTLHLFLSLAPPMEVAMNREFALKTIQEWKNWDNLKIFEFEKMEKLGGLAKKDKRIMKILLQELETRDAPNQFFVGELALLLGRIGAQEAIPALTQIIHDKTWDSTKNINARFSAYGALGRIGEPAIPILAKVLKSSDLEERRRAVYALGQMGDLGRDKKDPAVIPFLFEAMQDENEEVRNGAISSFSCSFSAKFAGPYLRKALQYKHPLVRAGAAGALICLKVHQREAEKTLIELLGHANVEVRVQALQGLGHEYGIGFYTKAAVAPLQKALKDKDKRVRYGAALALWRQGPAAEPALKDLLKALQEDADETVREYAAIALGGIGPAAKEAVPVLIAALKENNDLVPGISAINVLGDIGPAARAAIPHLERILQQSPDYFEVRLALAKIRGTKLPVYQDPD